MGCATIARLLAMAAMAGALAGAAPAPAPPPPDRWILDVSLGNCHIVRALRPEHAALSIQTRVGTGEYTLVIADKKVSRLGRFVGKVAVKVDGRVAARSYASLARGRGAYPMEAWFAGLDGGIIEAIRAGTELSIAADRGQIGPWPLPESEKAVAALRRCEADQLIEWGADPAQFKPGGTRPKVGDRNELVPQSLLRQIHFPKGEIEPLHYLVLSEAGVVEKCASVFGIPDSDFEQIVCGSLNGRKIGEPARDPAGKAVRGVVAVAPGLIITVITRSR